MHLSHRLLAKTILITPLIAMATVSGQWQKKPYTEWSQKDALNILNNSPWGQTYTDTSRMFDEGRRADSNSSRVVEVPQVKFRIRFFSSKPIRQATARLVALMQKGQVSKQLAAQLEALANADFPDYVVITVVTEPGDSGSLMASAAALLDKQSTSQLRNDTHLLVEGKRVFLNEYQPPRRDGLGARFVFPRLVDGKPFITADTDEVGFHSSLNAGPELNMRFKVKDMIFGGTLEY